MTTLGNSTGQYDIVNRIGRVSVHDKAVWGRMSAHQMICHLADSYRVPLGEKKASLATGLVQRTLLKWTALWVPLTWMKGYPTRPEIEQGNGGSPPEEFERDKETLLALVRRFCVELPQSCAPHPVFGEMKAREWWRWGYLHADHHLRQFDR